MLKFLRGAGHFIKRRWLLILILIFIGLAVFLFLMNKQKNQNKPLTYIQPEYRDLVKTLEVSGVVDADQKANLRFAAGGKVVYLGAKEGDTVKKGATIATIDQQQLQKQLQADLNTYTKERLGFDYTQDGLKNTAPTSQQNLSQQQTQLDLQNSVLNVEIQDVAIKNSRLSAPFGGILVSSPTATTGVNLLATDVFELINPDTLVFKAAVDEADVAQVHVGQPVSITLDAYPDQPLSGPVSYIAYKSQQTSTSTVYIIKIPITEANSITRYRLGMSGDATITTETKNHALSVPLDATRQREGKTYVDVKDGQNGKAEREIKAGLETDDYLEVVSGLTTDDQVVLPQSVVTKK